MAEGKPQKIDAPPGVASEGKAKPAGPAIFVMPEKYRGGKAERMAEPQKPPPKPAAPPPPPPPPKPAAPKKPLPKKKKTVSKPLLIGGVFLIVVLAAGGYFVLQSLKPPEVPIEDVVTTTPPPPPDPVTDVGTQTPPDGSDATQGGEGGDTASPFPQADVPGTDTDSDGLTDIEERTVYRTDPRRPDTDADGFLDGNEVFHRYNPNGFSPGTLLEAGLANEFSVEPIDDGSGYSLLYPSTWESEPSPEDARNVSFRATTGETISVTVLGKEAGQALADWHAAMAEGVPVVETKTKNGYDMLLAEDQLTAYVSDGTSVMVLGYSTGIKATIDYLQTFQMMINSMVWNEPVPAQ